MATTLDVSSLSDEELVRRCRRNRLEEWIRRSGCLVGLLAGLAAAATSLALNGAGVLGWSCFFTAYLAFITLILTGLSVYGLFESASRFRCRRFLRELEGRYGCRQLKEYVRAERRTISPNETVLILVGQGLPHGDHWWVRVRVRDGGRTGTVEARSGGRDDRGDLFDFGSGREPEDFFTVARAGLTPEAGRRLAELAGEVAGRSIRVRSAVFDGFPVSCAVIRGGNGRVTTVSCNLVGVPPSHAGKPHVRLVEKVFAAGRALINRPSGYGSTHFLSGDVEIGDL